MPQDYAQAMIWYQKAADQNYPAATFNIGIMYLQGEGVAVDNARGVDLIARSARAGFAFAEGKMATINYSGLAGQPVDKVKAYGWALLAADGGDPDASDLLDRMDAGHELNDDQLRRRRISPTPSPPPSSNRFARRD
ncbi:MAG: tetratricopeptide repeat protein [Asticcacaulis sp.]